MLARPLECEVKVQFTACAVALLLHIPVSHVLHLLPPVPQWLCWASWQQNPTKQDVLFLSELFRGFVLLDSFIHLIFLISEHSTKHKAYLWNRRFTGLFWLLPT